MADAISEASAGYAYDRLGNVQSMVYGNGVTNAYQYDALNRLTNLVWQAGSAARASFAYQVDLTGSRTTRMKTTKQYDYLNRLTQISSAPSASYVSPLTFNYNYNPANQRTRNTLVDGSYWIYGYDSLGQVTNACKYWSSGNAVAGQQFEYTFDTIGNRVQTQAGGDTNGLNLRVANYYANNLNQITNRDVVPFVEVTGASILTNAVMVNGNTAYRNQEYFWNEVPANNTNSALWTNILVSGGQSVTGNVYLAQEPETFKYDADGNLTNDGRWAYVWDAENRLIQMAVNTNVGPQYQLKFAYDDQGRRIQKIVATNGVPYTTNNFLYDGWNLIATLSATHSLINSFIWGNDLSGSVHGAGGIGGLLEVGYYGTTTTNCFPAFDGSANISALINTADGTLIANYEYGAFGEPIRMTGALARTNPFRFSTKYDDDESDLVYYGYRYYKPNAGTWINLDPIQEKGGLNLVCFCMNNAIGFFDAKGTAPIVYICVEQEDDTLDTSTLLRGLGQIPAVQWKIIQGPPPVGKSLGPDRSTCCSYYVSAKVITGGPTASAGIDEWFEGDGGDWEAWVAQDRVKQEFGSQLDTPDGFNIPLNWQEQNQEAVWNKINPFDMAHEVLHAIGAPHTTSQHNVLMTTKPWWEWLNSTLVPLDQATINNVTHLLNPSIGFLDL